MPYPFQPIVGSSFDSLGAQTRAWAGFSAGVDEGNLARAAQAQQVQNNWLAQAAQMKQAAMERDAQARAVAEAENYRRTQDLVQQNRWERQFESQKAQFKESIGAETARTKVMESANKLKYDILAAQEKESQAALDNAGTYYSTVYPKIARTWENQQHQYELLQGQQESFQATVNELKAKAAAGGKLTEVEVKKLMEAQKILNSLNLTVRSYNRHDSDYKQAEAAYNALQKQMARDGFEASVEDNAVRHNSGKVFNFKSEVAKAARTLPPPPTVATGTTPPPVAAPWAGFGTGTSAAVPAMGPTNTFKVGRFTVTTQ